MKHHLATLAAGVALLAAPAFAQQPATASAAAPAAQDSVKDLADLGTGVHKVKLAEDGSMKSCVVVGQARISRALGPSKGILTARKVAKQNAEAAFVAWLKTQVSDVRTNGDDTKFLLKGSVSGEGDAQTYEDAESTETNTQVTTSVSQGALRGMTLIGADQDASTQILTQVYAWKPAFAAAAAGTAGAMNMPDAAPGTPAPTGTGARSGGSAPEVKPAKGYETKTVVAPEADEFL